MSKPPPITREQFNYWIADMDDALDRFLERLPPAIKAKLDLSPASLDILESWILDTYPDTDSMLPMDQSRIVDGATRYVGEAYRKALGGHWTINLDDPKNVYYGVPILTGFEDKPTPACPLSLTTASARRRTGHYLRTVLENILRRKRAASG